MPGKRQIGGRWVVGCRDFGAHERAKREKLIPCRCLAFEWNAGVLIQPGCNLRTCKRDKTASNVDRRLDAWVDSDSLAGAGPFDGRFRRDGLPLRGQSIASHHAGRKLVEGLLGLRSAASLLSILCPDAFGDLDELARERTPRQKRGCFASAPILLPSNFRAAASRFSQPCIE